MRTTFNSSGIVPLITQFIQRGHTFLRLAAGSLARHPKRVSAIVSALLLGAGGGAFALASLAPDASELPVREVLESVQPALTISPFTANAVPLNLYRADITRSTDTADTLLKRLGVDDVVAANYLRTDQLARQMLLGRAGRNVTAETHEGQHLRKLVARWSPDDSGQFQRLVIERTPKGFVSRVEATKG